MALTGDLPALGSAGQAPEVLVGVMEFSAGRGVVSLVAVADGSTSLYFSTGGGIIGAGQHDPVRTAALRFLELTAGSLGEMRPTASIPAPDVGIVRFYARTAGGLFTADADQRSVVSGEDRLSPLFFAANEVLSAIRLHTPAGGRP